MMDALQESYTFATDSLGEFRRYRTPQIEILLHPNPANRILHTTMIGEMNGYMHALLVRRANSAPHDGVLRPSRAYASRIETDVTLPPATPMDIPRRNTDALSGSDFIASIADLPREAREAAVRRELLAGNIPSFLRTLHTIEVMSPATDGERHTIAYDVMPDYLAIGSDDDFVRMPMTPYTAQAFGDAFGFVLPTRKMVNDIWAAAVTRVDPKPLTVERESPRTFLQHHRAIETQLDAGARGTLVAGIKKDVVVTNRLSERPQRVAIYGWHYTNGDPIQPLYVGHVDWYVDYSHGIRPVRRTMRVDGRWRTFEEILADGLLHALLSDEGVISTPRYER